MATDYRTADAYYINSDVRWQAYVQNFEACLLASTGMVVASDTGQLNPATTTRPASGLPGAGFRMYRFDDAAQTTFPIFLRVDFVVATGQIFAMPTVRVSTQTDGAGAMTGTRLSTSTSLDVNTAGGTVGATRHFWASGGPGRLAFVTGDPSDTRGCCCIIVERMRKLDGSASSSGVFYLFGYGQVPSSIGARMGVIPHTSYGVNVMEIVQGAGAQGQPNAGASLSRAAAGNALCLVPYLMPMAPDWLSIMGLLGAPSGVTVHGGVINTEWMGASRAYMPLNNNLIPASLMDPSNLQGCILWE
jgi:hypothetical protein